MAKRETIKFLLILLSIFLLPLASAEMFIAQPQTLYNYGDYLETTITLTPPVETNAFLTADFNCANSTVSIYKASVHLNAGQTREVPIEIKLDPEVIGSTKGTCSISAKYGSESSTSQAFELSSLINVALNIDYSSYNPEDNVQITGTAIKANGQDLEGFIELYSEALEARAGGIVEAGKLKLNISLPADTPAGIVQISAHAYERDNSNNVANEGNSSIQIRVNQIPVSFSLALENEEFVPGSLISVKAILLDQTGNEMSKEAQLNIYNPNKEQTVTRTIRTSQQLSLTTEYNSSSGYWTITSSSENLTATRQVFLSELQNASFKVVNSTLTVANIGNVPYTKTVNITIGDSQESLSLNIPINQKKEFKLKAPNGEYSIGVYDGESTFQIGKTYLTGKAVSVETRDATVKSTAKIVSWILIIIALGIIVWHYYRKTNIHSAITRMPNKFVPLKKLERKEDNGKTLQGEKREVAIISLKVKNLSDLEKKKGKSFTALEDALSKARASGARITATENERMLVVPLDKENTRGSMLKAFALAQNLKKALENANNETYYKIEYGIGVHVSELLEGKEGKYSSLDNSFGITKRISSNAENEILCSEQAQKKVIGSIKAEKVADKNAWRVLSTPKRGLTSDLLRDHFG